MRPKDITASPSECGSLDEHCILQSVAIVYQRESMDRMEK